MRRKEMRRKLRAERTGCRRSATGGGAGRAAEARAAAQVLTHSPPVARISDPVTCRASSLARNTQLAAMSSGV
ncbi:MAG: hypothetical protein BWZ10_01654 [candidate division BRC1 bacterium ADurb.BinA364]|nr:MAG: hypothetical protein BWZ10_01654 [candidate division BRC1 bacterium ADurb.BinA364]